MKVIVFSDVFGEPTATFIQNEIKHLCKTHEIKYFCTKTNKDHIENFSNILEIPYKANTLLEKIRWHLFDKDIYCNLKNKEFSNRLNDQIKQFKPDIIHCHFGYEAIKLIDNIKYDSIPIIIHFHGYDASEKLFKKSYVRKLKKILCKSNIYSIVVTKSLLDNLQNAGINVANPMILYCGIDTDFFRKIGSIDKADDKKVFLQVSSLNQKKGHEYTIKAFAKFISKNKKYINSKLIITGDGPKKAMLIKLATELSIIQNLEFRGFVDSYEARNLMNKADFFVHHSVTASNGDQEGIPTSIMEAMSMELPILSSFHSGIPELVETNHNGILVDEKDVDAYVKAMEDIVNMPKKMINRKKIIEKFDLKIHNKNLEKIYFKIIRNDKSN